MVIPIARFTCREDKPTRRRGAYPLKKTAFLTPTTDRMVTPSNKFMWWDNLPSRKKKLTNQKKSVIFWHQRLEDHWHPSTSPCSGKMNLRQQKGITNLKKTTLLAPLALKTEKWWQNQYVHVPEKWTFKNKRTSSTKNFMLFWHQKLK